MPVVQSAQGFCSVAGSPGLTKRSCCSKGCTCRFPSRPLLLQRDHPVEVQLLWCEQASCLARDGGFPGRWGRLVPALVGFGFVCQADSIFRIFCNCRSSLSLYPTGAGGPAVKRDGCQTVKSGGIFRFRRCGWPPVSPGKPLSKFWEVRLMKVTTWWWRPWCPCRIPRSRFWFGISPGFLFWFWVY